MATGDAATAELLKPLGMFRCPFSQRRASRSDASCTPGVQFRPTLVKSIAF